MFKIKSKKEPQTALGTGFRLNDKKQRVVDIAIPDSDRKGHFWCFGTTRVGKTKCLENMVEQDIRKGYSTVVIDPKGDIELFSKIVQITMEEERLEDLIFITPIFPEYSAIIDPLAYYYMPEELVGHITSGVAIGKEPFFANVAYEISLVVVQALIMKAKAEGKRPNFSLLDVKNRISNADLKKLKEEIDTIDSEDARQLSMDMQKILDSPQDYYSKISSTLRVALTELTSGNIGKIIGKADENRFIKRLQEGKRVILIAHLGSLITRKAAFTVGKVIISMIQSLVGRVFSSGKRINPPLCIYIDEAQNVLYPNIDDLFAKGGGANVWIHGFCQSVNQIYAEIGKDKGNAILDNTNTKLFMRVPDSVTAKYVAGHFGTKRMYSPILSSGGNISSRELEEDILKPEDVLGLNQRVFYLTTYKGQYKGKTATTHPLYLSVKFPAIEVAGG